MKKFITTEERRALIGTPISDEYTLYLTVGVTRGAENRIYVWGDGYTRDELIELLNEAIEEVPDIV